jgi:hypothetical protein
LNQKLINKNEAQFGKEARALYGDSIVNSINAKLIGSTIDQHNKVQELSDQI